MYSLKYMVLKIHIVSFLNPFFVLLSIKRSFYIYELITKYNNGHWQFMKEQKTQKVFIPLLFLSWKVRWKWMYLGLVWHSVRQLSPSSPPNHICQESYESVLDWLHIKLNENNSTVSSIKHCHTSQIHKCDSTSFQQHKIKKIYKRWIVHLYIWS